MIWGYICSFRRRVVRFWAQMACRTNNQCKNYPWKPNCLWRDANNRWNSSWHLCVCLSLALASSLRGVVDTHVVGNMEDEGLNIWMDWILYSIFFPRASYFLVVLPEDKQDNQKHCCHNVYATLWAQMGLMKRAWNRRERAGCNFWKNNIAQGHNINPLKSNGSKTESNSAKPRSLICKLNDTPKGSMPVPRHYQKEWVIP